MNLKIKSISILGAGWLGLPLGASLAADGYIVRGATTRPERFEAIREAGMHPHEIEVTDKVRGTGLDTFFSSDMLILNIPPGRGKEGVEKYHPVQITQVLKRALAGKIRYLLFVSSTGVYGNLNRVVTEQDLPAPTRPSGKALVEAENILRAQHEIAVTIVRPGGLAGGNRKAGKWLAGKKNIPNGDANVNLVHRDDCIGAIHAIIKQGAWGEVFNLCADKHPSRREFYSTMAKKEGFEIPEFAQQGAANFKVVSNKWLKERLEYEFLYPDPMGF